MKTRHAFKANPKTGRQAPFGAWTKAFMILLIMAIIAAGALSASLIVRSAPKPKRRPPMNITPMVRVQTVQATAHTVVVEAMGTVIPARELILKSPVAGEVIRAHPEFMQGGLVRRGDEIIRLDDEEYALVVTQRESAVVNARYAIKLEQGRQDIARHEWKLLNGDHEAAAGDAELALRRPHMEKVRSDLAAAKAALAAARLQLTRTRIKAPFNAVVRETHVEIGSQVAAREKLAVLVGTDTYWIQASVPVDRLQWIDIPGNSRQTGAAARIIYQGGGEREGRVLKLLSDLESNGRMARLLIAVKDPLGMNPAEPSPPAMLIGEYVRVRIQGRRIDRVFRLLRGALRDNAHIWLADENGRLEIRKVQPIWRDADSVLIREGLAPGERLIVSNLATPVPGMAVRVVDKDPPGGKLKGAESQKTVTP